jgi:F420-dependent oxidoreductase-like protein
MARNRKITFALANGQGGYTYDRMLERARLAERLGFTSMWLTDHFFSSANPNADHPEALTLTSAVLAGTERLRVGSLVLCNFFRNPAYLAKALCTIDNISHGRLEIGLGAGWMKEEFIAYGYDFPPVGERLKRLEEGLRIITAMMTEARPNFSGTYYRISEAPNSPKPVQQPHPPITIGGTGRKVLLRLVAQFADRWNIPPGNPNLEELIAVLKDHCAAVRRDFDDIEVSELVLVCLGRDRKDVEEKWATARHNPFASTAIKGTPDEVIEAFRERVRRGVTMFIARLADPSFENLEFFAREVVPAF